MWPGPGPGREERPVPRPGARGAAGTRGGGDARSRSRGDVPAGPAGVPTALGSPPSRRHDAMPARAAAVLTSHPRPMTQVQRGSYNGWASAKGASGARRSVGETLLCDFWVGHCAATDDTIAGH